ncbi:MAG: reverse transcriptase-like protein, partial [Candidatus Electrothrix sp. AUS1_2]|nr:reverse transcriptase-like protein [Candidatus Electrothrix sp. AUS1_2]
HAALQPLFAEVKGLLSKLQHWTVVHVPREQNKRADELANQGIDERKK